MSDLTLVNNFPEGGSTIFITGLDTLNPEVRRKCVKCPLARAGLCTAAKILMGIPYISYKNPHIDGEAKLSVQRLRMCNERLHPDKPIKSKIF